MDYRPRFSRVATVKPVTATTITFSRLAALIVLALNDAFAGDNDVGVGDANGYLVGLGAVVGDRLK